MREPKNQMLGTMEPPPLMQLSVNVPLSHFGRNVRPEESFLKEEGYINSWRLIFPWSSSVIMIKYKENPLGLTDGC